MILFVLIKLIFSISKETQAALHKEDIRMAKHLIDHGMTVSHPDIPFLKSSSLTYEKIGGSSELAKEDKRMARHLALEGFTIN